MALRKFYPDDFEKIWAAYPKWPKGRSIKVDSYSVFLKLKRELELTPEDVEQIVTSIEKQKAERTTWQHGDKYGPQSLQRWLRIHGWNVDYETVRDKRRKKLPAHQEFVPAPKEERTFDPTRIDALRRLREEVEKGGRK